MVMLLGALAHNVVVCAKRWLLDEAPKLAAVWGAAFRGRRA
jgi:hypothetical protein